MAAIKAETRRRTRPGLVRRIVGFTIRLAALLIAIPLVLTAAYRVVDPPVSTLMLYQAATGKTIRRQWVDFDAISPHLIRSVLVSEDGRFCAHAGVDWAAVQTVFDEVEQGRAARGASTITMQTVKNLFLWSGRSYIRKGLEVPLAYYADIVLGKKRVFEIYLNIAEWGDGIFGAEAAAQAYFKGPANKLGPRSASRLATALPNPYLRNPAKPSPGHARLARIIQKRARLSGAYDNCLFAGNG